MKTELSTYGIYCMCNAEDIDSEKYTLKFYSNMYLQGSLIYWTVGGAEPLGNFINRLRIDSPRVFGPAKKHLGWPIAKLDELGAVGVYAVIPKTTALVKKNTAKKKNGDYPNWTSEEHKTLVRLADGTRPARLIAKQMGRSHQSVQSYAERHGISLAGYWTQKK